MRAIAIRAVSDTAATSLPYDFDRWCDHRGRVRLRAAIGELARKPQHIPALLHLVRDCQFAAKQLAEFLDQYVGLLGARLDLSQSEMVAAT